jgi:hypothetical protein
VFDAVLEQSRLVLTGIIISFVSKLIYNVTPTGFKSFGKFRTKEGAIFIYLTAVVVLGLVTPFIYELSGIIIQNVPLISIIGFLIVSANFIINQSVPTWSHTTPKTLIIYLLGIVIILMGYYFRFTI